MEENKVLVTELPLPFDEKDLISLNSNKKQDKTTSKNYNHMITV